MAVRGHRTRAGIAQIGVTSRGLLTPQTLEIAGRNGYRAGCSRAECRARKFEIVSVRGGLFRAPTFFSKTPEQLAKQLAKVLPEGVEHVYIAGCSTGIRPFFGLRRSYAERVAAALDYKVSVTGSTGRLREAVSPVTKMPLREVVVELPDGSYLYGVARWVTTEAVK